MGIYSTIDLVRRNEQLRGGLTETTTRCKGCGQPLLGLGWDMYGNLCCVCTNRDCDWAWHEVWPTLDENELEPF